MSQKRKKRSSPRRLRRTAVIRNLLLLLSVVAVIILVRGPRKDSGTAFGVSVVGRGLLAVSPVPPYLFESEGVEKPRRAVVAGQELFFRVQTVEGGPRDVLRFYRQKYQHSTSEFLRAVYGPRSGPEQRRIVEVFEALDRFYRAATDRSGMLIALELSRKGLAPEELARRVERFTKTGNLSEVWTARVINVYARGDSGRSTVVSFWTGPNFNIRALGRKLGRPAEPEGDDPVHPPLLTVSFPDEPRPVRFSLRTSEQNARGALEEARAQLLASGWKESTLPPGDSGQEPERLGTFERTGEELHVVTAEDSQGQVGAFVGFMHWSSS